MFKVGSVKFKVNKFEMACTILSWIWNLSNDSNSLNYITGQDLHIEWSGAYCFCPVCLFVRLSVCLFVCLSVVNFNIRYNFWTVTGRDFIFGMHTPYEKKLYGTYMSKLYVKYRGHIIVKYMSHICILNVNEVEDI